MAMPRLCDYPSLQATEDAAWIPKCITLEYGYKKKFSLLIRSILGDVIHAYLVDLGWFKTCRRQFVHPYVSAFEAHMMVRKLFTLPIIREDNSALRFVRLWATPESRDAILINGRILKEGRVFVPRHLLPSPPPPGWVTPASLPPPDHLGLPIDTPVETMDPTGWLVRSGEDPRAMHHDL